MASPSEELFAAIEAGDADGVRVSLDHDPSLSMARDDEGVSALMRARYRSDRSVMDSVRRHVASLDLFEAATFGDLARIEVVLGQDDSLIERRTGDGFTALHLAAFFGATDAVASLLERGADPNARGTGWMTGTALHSAVSARHPEIVRMLLGAGADPNARQAEGWTALHGAAHNGDRRTVEVLLAGGADPRVTDDAGRSAADFAQETGDTSTRAAIDDALG